METAIVRFAPAGDSRTPTVDLVAAVHIADAAYYKQLNREFQAYDAVLYELVAPEGKRPKPGDHPSDNPLSMIQNGMKDILDLEFQLNGIDYTRKNMVHADMSPDEFAKSMRQRGESAWTIFGRILGYALAKQNQTGGDVDGAELLAAMFSKNRAMALKRLVAEQFQESEDALAALEGPKGSTLISGRNQVAIAVLRKEIAAGKIKIAIFYGAGHMPDFQKRLRDDFGMKPVSTRWLAAWNLKAEPKPSPKAAAPASGVRNR
jgi:predicted regulator of Ras-like GTPase activity (Roadblock/LC7/MglB family)